MVNIIHSNEAKELVKAKEESEINMILEEINSRIKTAIAANKRVARYRFLNTDYNNYIISKVTLSLHLLGYETDYHDVLLYTTLIVRF